jgi:DNA-binding transcriptional MerR regulator
MADDEDIVQTIYDHAKRGTPIAQVRKMLAGSHFYVPSRATADARAKGMHLLRQGHRATAVARAVGVTTRAVRNWSRKLRAERS